MAQQEELRERYKTLSDDELVRLHQNGTLSDMAYAAIEAEMLSRGIPVQTRPVSAEQQYPAKNLNPTSLLSGIKRSISDHFSGRARLLTAYWGYGVLGNVTVMLLFVGLLFLFHSYLLKHKTLFVVYMNAGGLFIDIYRIFSLICIWRCAPNTKWEAWTYIARLMAIIVLFLLVYRYVLYFMHK